MYRFKNEYRLFTIVRYNYGYYNISPNTYTRACLILILIPSAMVNFSESVQYNAAVQYNATPPYCSINNKRYE